MQLTSSYCIGCIILQTLCLMVGISDHKPIDNKIKQAQLSNTLIFIVENSNWNIQTLIAGTTCMNEGHTSTHNLLINILVIINDKPYAFFSKVSNQ